jgi:hypothetical protein
VTDEPTPLRAVGATELERRLLEAAANERPSPELTRRMQRGLGLSAAVAVTAASAASQAVVVTKTVTKTVFWARVSSGILAAVVAGGVIGSRVTSRAPAPAPAHVHATPAHGGPGSPVAPQEIVAQELAPQDPAPREAAPDLRPRHPKHRSAVAREPDRAGAEDLDRDLRREIALIDAARSALRAGAPERALALLQRHAAIYRAGTFRPEATALRIEALAASGRTAEAGVLARRFVAEHPQSPLSERVARIADLKTSPPAPR